MIGEIRLISFNRAFERSTMAVTAGVSRDGMIGLVDAETLVVAGDAAWLWRDDSQLEAPRQPEQPASHDVVPVPTEVSLPDLATRIERAKGVLRQTVPVQPPELVGKAPLSASDRELVLAHRTPTATSPQSIAVGQ